MSTVATILTFARAQAQTDSNGLTDAKGIIFANSRLVDFHRQLVRHGVDASQIQETYIPTVTVPATGNGSTFLYPVDCLGLKTIEVNYTDSTSQNYIRAEQIDVSNLPNQTAFSWLRQNGSTQAPKFDDHGDWYEIFPSFTSSNNLTNAIRLFYFLKPTLYTATSDTVSYPESQDDTILGWGIASDYMASLSKFDSATAFDKKYQDRVTQYISTLGRGSQQPLQATPIQDAGWTY